MKQYTGHIAKGKCAPLHNLREYSNPRQVPQHIDFERTKDNEILVNRTLREVYDERFGAALETYNAKRAAEGHYDNQIHDYLDHVEHSKTVKPMYEFVVQCGNVDEHPAPETAKQIYKEWLQSFEKSYGSHFAVKQAVIHMDETTPHMHIEVVPVAESKRGLPVQNSLNKAVEQSGFSKANGGYKAMLHAWDESLGEVMRQHGLERVAGDKERQAGGVPIAEYKAVMAARAEVDRLKKQAIARNRSQARAAQKEKYAEIGRKAATKRAKERLERLRGSSERVESEIGDLESEIRELKQVIRRDGDHAQRLEGAKNELRKRMAEFESSKSGLGERIRGLEQGIKRQQGELGAIRARVGELESEKSEISKNVRELIESIKKCLAELTDRIQDRLRALARPAPTVEQTGGLSRAFAQSEEPKPAPAWEFCVRWYTPDDEGEMWYTDIDQAEMGGEFVFHQWGCTEVEVYAVNQNNNYAELLRRWDPSDLEPPTPNRDYGYDER